MFTAIAYLPILFGKPLVMYLGILTFLALIFTASIGYASFRGLRWVPFKYHPWMALTTIILAIIHGVLGLAIQFGF